MKETRREVGPVKEYLERWKAVAEREKEELREASPASNWKRLNALLRLAVGLGLNLDERDEEAIAQVRRRWIKLKEAKRDDSKAERDLAAAGSAGSGAQAFGTL